MLAISKRIHSFNASLLSAEKSAEEVEEETPPEPQGPPEPEPGSEDWEYVDQPIEVVCALLIIINYLQIIFFHKGQFTRNNLCLCASYNFEVRDVSKS